MLDKPKDMTPEEARQALAWLAEMGADEVIGETPINRFASPSSAPLQERVAVAESKPRVPTGNSAAEIAAACQSLEEIAAALNAFEASPLKKTATQLCYCDGKPDADVMLIGEAPGRDEDLQGKPLVGRSGQLLDRMLAAIGLSRQGDKPDTSVFITNVIFWRPPGNRTPTEQETAQCMPFLKRTIELQRPRVIVCLGATPTQRLIGKTEGILKLRGKWFSVEADGRSIPLLATLHPAYLLRQPAQKRLSWRDLVSLKIALTQGPPHG
jgi:DNA polymerase